MALNQDIGFIHLGQKAELKLDTFPFQKYGTIEAELSYVSPDAQEDQKIGLVYKIKLKPKRFTIRVRDKDIPISPGMAVTAEIKTGERRVIEFFISPFIKYVDESLTLRWFPFLVNQQIAIHIDLCNMYGLPVETTISS